MKTYGSQHGTSRLYVVEARTTNGEIRQVHGVMLDGEWRRLHTGEIASSALVAVASITVPAPRWPYAARECGLLSREAAYALAVRFQLEHGDSLGATLCVEVRLVEVELTYGYDTKEIGVCEPFSLFEHLRWLKSAPREGAAPDSPADPVTPVESKT